MAQLITAKEANNRTYIVRMGRSAIASQKCDKLMPKVHKAIVNACNDGKYYTEIKYTGPNEYYSEVITELINRMQGEGYDCDYLYDKDCWFKRSRVQILIRWNRVPKGE